MTFGSQSRSSHRTSLSDPCRLSCLGPAEQTRRPVPTCSKGDNQAMSSEDKKHRSHLPIPTPERPGLTPYDAKDPDPPSPPLEHLGPPAAAPNVLLILIDDAGF